MEVKEHGQEAAQSERHQERPQESKAQPVAADMDVSAYEEQIADRDERIKALEAQVADAAKTAETAEQLKLSSNPFWYQQSAKLGTDSQRAWYRE